MEVAPLICATVYLETQVCGETEENAIFLDSSHVF
jgi:hypothetical protein